MRVFGPAAASRQRGNPANLATSWRTSRLAPTGSNNRIKLMRETSGESNSFAYLQTYWCGLVIMDKDLCFRFWLRYQLTYSVFQPHLSGGRDADASVRAACVLPAEGLAVLLSWRMSGFLQVFFLTTGTSMPWGK
ncbi:hypothetical protein GOODEAATRI_014308 [Goodea atripinnis]|uniref:Uncharacterized protein n=1 Tax=Goodea atripinnis TaxID=208336 RepID=A0ABV0PXZ1_9TELE